MLIKVSMYNKKYNLIQTFLIYNSAQLTHAEKIKGLVKSLYDYGQKSNDDETFQKPYLDELVVDEMDDEQIWQQLELKNEQLLTKDLSKTSQVLSFSSKRIQLAFKKTDPDCRQSDDDMNENSADNSETEMISVSRIKKKATLKERKTTKRSVVDDKFFNLEEMARFLDEEDERESRRQEGKPEKNPLIEIDYFDEHTGEVRSSN